MDYSVPEHVMHARAASGHFSAALGGRQDRIEHDMLELGFRSRESLDGGISACHVATWSTVVHLSVARREGDVCTAAGHFSTAIGG